MNNYEALGMVGEGAYGIVLKCIHKSTRETFAIKKFKDRDSEDPAIKKVITRELKGLRGLRHANIINLKDAFRQNERLYLVFEYCEKSLLDLMNVYSKSGIPVSLIKSISFQILKALHFMHERDYVHRDIKPENILLTQANKVKICDFGFCRELKKRGQVLTDYVATRWYRSPELLLTPRYGKSVDIWALGCVMGEMIIGDPIFPGDNFIDQLHQIHQQLGKLPEIYQSLLADNKETARIDYGAYLSDPSSFKKDALRSKLFKICKNAELVDLILKMLELDFTKRISAEDALLHPFFHDLNEFKENQPKNLNVKSPVEPLKESSSRKDFIIHTSQIKSPTNLFQSPDEGKQISKVEIKFSTNSKAKQRNSMITQTRHGYLPTIKNPVHRNTVAFIPQSITINSNTLGKVTYKLQSKR